MRSDVLAAGLHRFLHLIGALRVVADKLLDFVQHQQREWEAAVGRECLTEGPHHFVAGHVGHMGVLVAQRLQTGRRRAKQVRFGGHKRCRQPLGHVKVVELLLPVVAFLLQIRLHLHQKPFAAQPHDKACLWVLLGQASRFEDDAQDRQPHASFGAGAQGAGRSVQAAGTLAGSSQLDEQVADDDRQMGDAARCGAVGKEDIHPQRAHHLDHVRLAGAKETAHPDRRLLRRSQVAKVCMQNMFQPLGILAVADKGLQLVAEYGERMLGRVVVDAGDPLIDQLAGGRILLVDSTVEHVELRPYSLSAVIGTAR